MSDNESKNIHVLAISYGRDLFVPGNVERQRMVTCAKEVASYHMVVFTHHKDNVVTMTEVGLTLHPTNSRHKVLMLWDAYRLGRHVVNTVPGTWVVTAQDPFEAGLVGWLIARKHKLALNVQEHADYFSTAHWRQDTVMNRLRYYLGRFFLKRADSVRVVSKRIQQTIGALGVPHEHIFTLPVRTDQIANSATASSGDGVLRQQYPGALIVLTMARLVSQKNLALLIGAFGKLASQKPEALLVIVGKGNEEQQLRDLVQQLKLRERVVFLPWTDKPAQLLSEADIYALSSNWEGWARVLLEAMAAGVPVVTTDVGCAGEVLLDGQHGYVVPVDDEKKFAERLIELANDQGKRIAFGAAAQVAANNFHVSPQTYASAWADVLFRTHKLHRK